MNNYSEIEVLFYLVDKDKLRKRLKELGARPLH